MLLLIDNYDSFTHNLARYFVELGQNVNVVRNDKVSLRDVETINPEYLVLSPGPCTPDEAGVSLALVEKFAGKIPILGVCLGHQAIAQAFGGRIVEARSIQHGMTSEVEHSNTALFKKVRAPFTATRYHSLVAEPNSLPNELNVTAWVKGTDSANIPYREIMAFEHEWLPIYGVQFHPESLLTEYGHQILENFLTHPNNLLEDKTSVLLGSL